MSNTKTPEEILKEIKTLIGDLDPIEVIKVTKKHSSFELILENILLSQQNRAYVEALKESNLQIEYLHKKFKETGTGMSVISRNKSLIQNEGK